ncbi:hypothetical protein DIS13_09325 [Weissella paramesenteroides]|uniref:hypothetical protein n=1 Tax=Weissella paramesenteroides TaxID=1249 RepID=UPI00112E3AFE|nr:hypothetical protein [Weissella paramesenteroides]TOY71532.1 hypothetical protein DIS13_09325 [Weissella paramesenteroides]
MTSKETATVAAWLRRYPELDVEIKRTEFELMVKRNETDENIGGGRMQNNNTHAFESTVIKVVDDKKLNTLTHNQKTIRRMVGRESDEMQTLINELYFKRHTQETMVSLAIKFGVSRALLFRQRNAFFKRLYKRLLTEE